MNYGGKKNKPENFVSVMKIDKELQELNIKSQMKGSKEVFSFNYKVYRLELEE